MGQFDVSVSALSRKVLQLAAQAGDAESGAVDTGTLFAGLERDLLKLHPHQQRLLAAVAARLVSMEVSRAQG